MDEERRNRFLQWVARTYGTGRGVQVALKREIERQNVYKYTEGRISQLFDKRQPFGEEAAKKIALALGLPERMFLVDQEPPNDGSGLSSDSLEIAIGLDKMKVKDLVRHSIVMPFVRLAVLADPPTEAAQRHLWAEELANLLRASLERIGAR